MTIREDAVRRAAEELPHDHYCDTWHSHGNHQCTCSCDRDELAEAAVDAVVPPGHVVIEAEVLDVLIECASALGRVFSARAAQSAFDAWTEDA